MSGERRPHPVPGPAPAALRTGPPVAAPGRPARAPARTPADRPVPLTVSGATADARSRQAALLADALAGGGRAALAAAARTAGPPAPRQAYRATVVAGTAEEAVQALRALAYGRPHPALVSGADEAGGAADAAVVLFTAHSPPPPRTGRELYSTFPAFRAAFDAVREAVDTHLPLPLAAVVLAPEDGVDAELIRDPRYARPALFAFHVALLRLWEACGVRVGAVAGDGTGILAAAHAAGVLGLSDAARLAAAAGRSASDLRKQARGCRTQSPRRALVCTATGDRIGPGPGEHPLAPRHLLRAAAPAAGPAAALHALAGAGLPGAHPCAPDPAPAAAHGELRAVLMSLARFHACGQPVAWATVLDATGVPAARPAPLPELAADPR
ncbi:acyltransferase domain-containing protein [Streptomyces sp. NPDC059389]|uniref:acyltransferase domain-containing protein n=1 Tax=Streptomyces sp. NPDC059389 TaxID=3346818 RepID=UPI0036C31530